MNWSFRSGLFLVSLCAVAAVVIGCDAKLSDGASAGPPEPLPAGLVVAAAPEGARGVVDVRNSAGEGERVVVRGIIGGSEKPFADGKASFQLVDASMPTCDKAGHMKGCPTPWDYCCDDPDDISGKSVTVQVVGASGQPLRAKLEGVGGLKPMSEVFVKGTVHKGADGKTITVNAVELFAKQG